MSLFSSSSSTRSNGGSSTGAAAPVEGGFIDFAKLINSLGNKNPKDYFGGASRLQNAAYSMAGGMANRWGANYGQIGQAQQSNPQAMGFGTVKLGNGAYGPGGGGGNPYVTGGASPLTQVGQGSGGGAGGQSLYGAAGIETPQGTTDYAGYVNQNPAILNAWRNLTPKDRSDISQVMGDGSGGLSIEDFGRYQLTHEGSDGFNVPQNGGGSPGGAPSPFNQNFAEFGYADANEPYNPVADWRYASNVARNAAYSGPNLAGIADLGQANTYDATGYSASGPANSQTYDASGQAASQGYTANRAGSQGYDASTIGADQRIDMGGAAGGNARRGIEFSEDYENEYTDNVVNSTLANFDEFAGRQRAAEAAQAAGNNAFGGSRFAVQRAITEEQIARERASAESGLRFDAQDKAFNFGMQDAQRFTDTSIANAQMKNQRAEAQAGMDMNRLLANLNAQNTASQFGANAANVASLDNAGRADQAGAFGADAANRAALDAVNRSDTAAAFGADAANRSALDFASRDDAGRAFSASAQNEAGQFNANSQNQFDLTQFGAANDMARFNAGQADTADTRQLNAANSLSNIANTASANQRADLQSINALGVDQRNIEQQQRTADLELMRIMQQMYGGMPWFTEQRNNQSSSQTSTPSTASILGSAAMAASGLPFGSIGSALGMGGGIQGPIIQDSVNGAFYT